MSENIRIKTTPGGGDKSVNININQKFDFIEILSLKISQSEAYRRFCSDYGVVVGRVIVNNGVGVPNAKVSIFVPIDAVDTEDPETSGLYPYEVTTDVDRKGIAYNLLPRNNRGKDECFTAIGTFPSKREIQDNPEIGDIYCKYYKFTTTTNESGDFMFFGVPTGTHFMHVDADISDIGFLSQRPYDLINNGASKGSFQSASKFKGRKETSSLIQLRTSTPITITVPPFWGDTEQCSIGITRSDVNLSNSAGAGAGGLTITPTALFMGSIISDNDKHAVSRNCVPRRHLGRMDELVTGDGSIEMIRKTPDGGIERFDIEGGQLIDEDGVWAYQIPMNTNYMVTAEDGTFVPSGDETKGIPTKARVRFRVGMNTNGDEGKLRTRAKFLIPHNPDNYKGGSGLVGVDFSFGSSTTDDHFRDLDWNNIYTVKNHIPRLQVMNYTENRNFTGIKNVDDAGDRNPFPFNKMDNDTNPLFTFLCILIYVFAALVSVMNFIMIPILNIIFAVINRVMQVICMMIYGIGRVVCNILSYKLFGGKDEGKCLSGWCIGTCNDTNNCTDCECKDPLGYVPYITMNCDEKYFAPGGFDGKTTPKGWVFEKSINATHNKVNVALAPDPSTSPDGTTPPPPPVVTTSGLNYPNDGAPDHACKLAAIVIGQCDGGWAHCLALTLADSLDVFKFDFYNDWVNGSLYAFLLKYKVKDSGKTKFCDVDCGTLDGDFNNDGNADNRCKKRYLLDTGTMASPQNAMDTSIFKSPNPLDILGGVDSFKRVKMREGWIKKFDGEIYYSPYTRTKNYKLFATDIVSLGSVFNNTLNGAPKMYQYLIDTTFNIPDLYATYSTDGLKTCEETGFDTGLVGGGQPLIASVTCLGLATISQQTNNIKRLSELGMGLDLNRTDDGGTACDNRIGNHDIESDFIRGIFLYANGVNSTNLPVTPSSPARIAPTNIDANIYYQYDDEPYAEFRGVTGGNIWQYDNSFYFYFGLNKGNTALSKMKSKYLVDCIPETNTDYFIVSTNITPDGPAVTPDGSISIKVIGGNGPYKYSWTGPTVNVGGVLTPFPTTPLSTGQPNTNTISPLYGGSYTVKVTDKNGQVTEGVFIVPGPPAIDCDTQTTPVSVNGASDGTIIVSISSGLPMYSLSAQTYDPAGAGSLIGPVTILSGLAGGTTITGKNAGFYQITVEDSGTPITRCQRVVQITQPDFLSVVLSKTDITCNGASNGIITATITGGTLPYTVSWDNGITSTATTIGSLAAGTYNITVADNNGLGPALPTTVGLTIIEPSKIAFDTIVTDACGGSPTGTIEVKNIVNGTVTAAGYTVKITGGDTGVNIVNNNVPSTGIFISGFGQGVNSSRYLIEVIDANGCSIGISKDLYVPVTQLAISTSTSTPSTGQIEITATASDGVWNDGTSAPLPISYHMKVEVSIDGGVTYPTTYFGKSDLGAGKSKSITVPNPAVTNAKKYRFTVWDKDGNGCSVSTIRSVGL